MEVYTFLCVLSMAVAIAEGTGAVNLSADALPIPGGYVVPERGNITFTCVSSSGKTLFWNLRVAESDDRKQYARIDVGTTGLNRLPGFSIPDESSTTNPASFTFHNISSENNPSPVQCSDLTIQENSTAMIIVEGPPNCPIVHATMNTTILTVSIQKLQMKWLPEWYSVQVISYNGSIASIVHNSTLNGTASFEVTPIQPDTVYNITVIPCNMAGCNESCDVHSVQTDSDTSIVGVPTGTGETPHVVTSPPLIFIGTAILVTMVLLLLLIITSISVGVLIRRKRGKQTVPQTSNVDAVHVHHASLQLQDHDVTSATAAQYMNEGETSSDITMEDNPAYQSIVMESAGSNYI